MPVVVPPGRVDLPAFALVLVFALLAYLPMAAWLAFFYWLDRRREPKRLIGTLFLLGLGATVPAAVLNTVWEGLSFGEVKFSGFGISDELLRRVVLFYVLVALTEEALKYTFASLSLRRERHFDEPLDGIIYFTTVALGFAAAENFEYISSLYRGGGSPAYGVSGSLGGVAELAVARAFVTTWGHVAWSGIAGYFFARHVLYGRPIRIVLASVTAAAALHAVHNISYTLAERYAEPYVPGEMLRAVQVSAGAPVLVLSVVIYAYLFRRAVRQGVHPR